MFIDMENEIWKDIPGWEGRYNISNFGRVKSLDWHKSGKEKVMAVCNDTSGYPMVVLRKEGKGKTQNIHRIVANVFIPMIEGKSHVNHKNGIRTDNRTENLEWCTPSENALHRYRILKSRHPKIGTAKKVLQLLKDGTFIKEWESRKQIQEITKMSACNISACCSGKIKTSLGFIWKYKV